MFVLEIDDLDPREGRKYVYEYAERVLIHGDELEHAEVFIEADDLSSVPWPTTVNEALTIERTFAPQRPKRVPVFFCAECAKASLTETCHKCERMKRDKSVQAL